jgi:carbamoyl-phosphate synthase large subunit
MGHILVTSASRKVPLLRAVQTAARKLQSSMKVIAGDIDPLALAQYVADDFWLMPNTEDCEVSLLVDGCKQRGIKTILPTRDSELLHWSRVRSEFAKVGIAIIVSPADSVERCLDKLAFSRFGLAHGFPFIPAAIYPDEVGLGPYVVKERYGAGSRNIGLNLERAAARTHGDMLQNAIYQPFISGSEISIDAWIDNHHDVKGLILRRRDRIENGESQITTTFRNTSIEKVAIEVFQALSLRGPVVMQAIVDDRCNVFIIECNVRIGGASTISLAAGLDMIYWSLLEQHYGAHTSSVFNRAAGEFRQIRVPSDILIHGTHF